MQPTAINAILQVIEIRKATIAPPGLSDLTLATELDIRIEAGTAPYLCAQAPIPRSLKAQRHGWHPIAISD